MRASIIAAGTISPASPPRRRPSAKPPTGATADGYANAKHYAWGGPGDGTRSRDELRALDVLGLETDADFETIRAAWRTLAKECHPDLKPGDAAAAERFRQVQAAYDVLRSAEESRGPSVSGK